jgi:uncharacterized protein DUF5947
MAAMPQNQRAFATLRKYVRQPNTQEACALCGAPLGGLHRHLVEPGNRKIACACRPCALLFGRHRNGRYRLIPEQVQLLEDFRLSDAQWKSLHLPINLAFFFFSSPMERVVAIYPSPVGATESLLPLEDWQDLENENPILGAIEPDVEALLVNRVGSARDHYRVPIDECYKLVGLLRTKWHGLSGGAEVWRAVAEYFEGLQRRSSGKEAARETKLGL